MHSIRRRLALAAVPALLVALVACAPESGSPTPTGSASSGMPSASPSATPTPTPTPEAACLPGFWTMDQAGLEEFYNDINDLMAGAGVRFTPTGTAALTLAEDGTFIWAPDARVTADVAGTTIDITLAGEITGTYTSTDSRISTDTSSADGLTVTATVGGSPIDPGAVTEEIAAAPITDASYVCTDDTLTLETAISGGSVTTLLHRN